MRIAFDSLCFSSSSINRGIGFFSLNLIKGITREDKKNSYYLFNVLNESNEAASALKSENILNVYTYIGAEDTIWEKNELYGSALAKFIEAYKIDVFIITSPYNTIIKQYKREWFGNAFVVGLLHDAIPFILKDAYLPEFKDLQQYLNLTESISRFDLFFANSQSTKKDFAERLRFDQNKIHVINCSAHDCIRKIKIDPVTAKLVKHKFNIISKFILFVSGDDLRKNNANTIKAYFRLPQNIIRNFQLVIACQMRDTEIDKFRELIPNAKLYDRVIFTKYVNNQELLYLYNLAHIFIFPSQYEGFGMPIIEAFKCDLPLLTSKTSSMKEIASNAAIFVNPFSVNSISKGLKKIINLKNRDALIQSGREKLKIYNWNTVCKMAINVLKTIKPNKIESMRIKKIAMFTPLPPLKSGISDYSLDIINSLSKYVDIDVYIDDGYLPNVVLPKNVKVFNHSEYTHNFNKYDKTIYEMGASIFHTYMLQYIANYEGVVELHDGMYDNLMEAIKSNKKTYDKIMNQKVPLKLLDLENLSFYSFYKNDPILYFIVRSSDNFIVHNDFIKRRLLSVEIKKILKIYLYTKHKNTLTKKQARNKLKIKHSDIVFVSLGMIHPYKQSYEELVAFSRFVKTNKNIKAKYYFVGELDPCLKNKFETYIIDNNLQRKVIVTGYVGAKDFNTYIFASDLHFNLRKPYRGESSSVLSNAISKALPTVANDVGVFAELPNNCLKKIKYDANFDETVSNIYDIMCDFVSNRNKYIQLGRNAQIFAKNNYDIEKNTQKILSFLNNDRVIRISNSMLENSILRNDPNIDKLIKTLSWIIEY